MFKIFSSSHVEEFNLNVKSIKLRQVKDGVYGFNLCMKYNSSRFFGKHEDFKQLHIKFKRSNLLLQIDAGRITFGELR
eukprot:snap_masked-scaffold_7-processed-gene-13.42-mRNA-1 protein AED:1.00 eAED:1.00 QI:0/0/0/0/1/1/2/0/77